MRNDKFIQLILTNWKFEAIHGLDITIEEEKTEGVGEEGYIKRKDMRSRPGDNSLPNSNHSLLFSGGGSIQSFAFRLQTVFLFIYLFFGSAVTVHLPHLKRRALECMLTLFPGVLAEQRAYCWVEHRFTRYANSFAAHRLWGAGFSNLSPTDQHKLKLYSFIPQTNHS